MMRDIEAAFDVEEPEGWWTLTVTGTGTVHVVPMMKHGEARIVLPVVQPAVCGTGAVTRTGTVTRGGERYGSETCPAGVRVGSTYRTSEGEAVTCFR